MSRAWDCLLLAVLAVAAAPQVHAHATSTSYLTVAAPLADGPISVRWDIALADLA